MSCRISISDASSPVAAVITQLGALPSNGIAALCAFGLQAEALEYPCIDVGGFIVPGRDPAISPQLPGMEFDEHGRSSRARAWGESPRQETGSKTGQRPRPASPQAAASGASTHTLEQRLSTRNLDLSGLAEYHPLARVIASSETVEYLNIPIGLFHELPIHARLTLEVPLTPRDRLSRHSTMPTTVPDVRAWAVWEGGPMHGSLVISHHENPDHAICANIPGEWLLGVHPLRDYVAFCALWTAKALHELLIGFYPGLQHYPAYARVKRDRLSEYCGCGEARRYAECCRDCDHRRTSFDHWREAYFTRRAYMRELIWQARPLTAPLALLQMGLTTAPV